MHIGVFAPFVVGYVDPAFRSYAALLVSQALKHKNVTYLNISAAPHTRRIADVHGYTRYSDGTFVAVVGLSSLAGLLSVSGIGTRDWALIALLGRENIGHDTALAASFLILFLNLTNIVPGLIAWYRDPVPLRSRTPPEARDLRGTSGVAP